MKAPTPAEEILDKRRLPIWARLLLSCLGNKKPGVDSWGGGPKEWADFLDICTAQGVSSIVYRALVGSKALEIPAFVMENLRSIHLGNAARCIGIDNEIRRVENRFNKNRIAVLPLKGVALSRELYGDISIREAGDIDLLVHPAKLAEAEKLLAALGYIRNGGADASIHRFHTVHYHPRLKTYMELHYGLTGPHFGFALPAEEYMRQFGPSGPAARRPGARPKEYLFLYLCIHLDAALSPRGKTMKWLSDLAAFIGSNPDLDWNLIQNLVKKAGRWPFASFLLWLIYYYFDVEPPLNTMRELDESTPVLKALNIYHNNWHQPPGKNLEKQRLRLNLLLRRRPSQKLRLLSHYIHPDGNDYHWIKLPPRFHGFYYFLRPLRFLIQIAAKI